MGFHTCASGDFMSLATQINSCYFLAVSDLQQKLPTISVSPWLAFKLPKHLNAIGYFYWMTRSATTQLYFRTKKSHLVEGRK